MFVEFMKSRVDLHPSVHCLGCTYLLKVGEAVESYLIAIPIHRVKFSSCPVVLCLEL